MIGIKWKRSGALTCQDPHIFLELHHKGPLIEHIRIFFHYPPLPPLLMYDTLFSYPISFLCIFIFNNLLSSYFSAIVIARYILANDKIIINIFILFNVLLLNTLFTDYNNNKSIYLIILNSITTPTISIHILVILLLQYKWNLKYTLNKC